MRVMTDAQVVEMWNRRQSGSTLKSLAKDYDVHPETIRYAIKNLVPRILAAQAVTPLASPPRSS